MGITRGTIKITSLLLALAAVATAQMTITEWMYSGTDGEFVEFTNTGSDSIDMTGWSFSDDTATAGTQDLSAFGAVEAGESVILTDVIAADIIAAWNLRDVDVVGLSGAGLGRNDRINLYDSAGTLVDSLAYGDETYPGTPRTQYASCNIPASDYALATALVDWSIATLRDEFGSRTSTGGDIASPGRILGYAFNDYDMDGYVDVSDLIVFASCFTGSGVSYDTMLAVLALTADESGFIAADGDEDYDVDLADFSLFAGCYAGSSEQAQPLCGCTLDTAGATYITLLGSSATVEGSGAAADGSTVTITAPGTYSITGTLADGQIVVNSPDNGTVKIILNGINVYCSTSAPFDVIDASFISLILADGTDNYLSDASTYNVFDDLEMTEPSGCMFSDAGISISGNGSLDVQSNYNDGIVSKDELIIYGGEINVTSVDDGIRGKDSLLVYGGDITLTTAGDGLKSDNADDTALGCITIAGGSFDITSTGDALTAQTNVNITGGEFTLVTGGGYTASISTDLSAKGIKGVAAVVIDGGTFTMYCADDAIHSNDAVTVNGGSFTIYTGDDGLHADNTLTVNGGLLVIPACYEGLESCIITINDGDIKITASDDGINVAGGADGSGTDPWDPWRPRTLEVAASDYCLYINGGYTVVRSGGDGLDANGSIVMTGGTTLVHGPTANDNGPLDYDGTFLISGGTLIASGSSGMAQAPSTSSSQRSVKITFSSWQAVANIVHLENAAGTDIATFAPQKTYNSCVISTPNILSTTSYKLYSGGSSTGTKTGGLYEGGTYTPGTLKSTFTPSSIVTNISVY